MMTLLDEFRDLRPAGGFDLIMADPPWSYQMYSAEGYRRAPEAHYQTMSLADICALPAEALAAQDCLLWLWAVGPQLPQALKVMESWGFAFKTSGHWAKVGLSGKQAFGTGYLLRCAGEPFLIGTRGAPRTTRVVRSVLMAPAREHSRKPAIAFSEAVRLMPDARRIELFSRERRDGWSTWGDETGTFGAGKFGAAE